jgi:Asp/Glu/hydantoin racemase
MIGLQDEVYFKKGILDEVGVLDTEKLEKEVVKDAKQCIADDATVKAVLLECSCLPPYGAAIQKAVGVPVFDYITMINFVFSAVVKQKFEGYM